MGKNNKKKRRIHFCLFIRQFVLHYGVQIDNEPEQMQIPEAKSMQNASLSVQIFVLACISIQVDWWLFKMKSD